METTDDMLDQSREKQQQCKCGVAAFVEALTRAALPSNCTSLLGQIQLLIQRNTFPDLEKYIFDKYILKFYQYVHFETNI